MKKFSTLFSFLISAIWLFAQPPAPDFLVTDVHGNQHRLYDNYLNQGKTVVLKLFFVACPPCNQIAGDTETLYQDWGGNNNPDVEFFSLTIQANDNNADVLGYETMHGITYPGISASGGALAAVTPYRDGTYGQFGGTPTFVVIAPDGTVEYDVFGAGISGTITAIDNAIRDSRPVVQPNRTITLQIEDGIVNNGDCNFSVENDGQSYAPDMGTSNEFTVPSGSDYDIQVDRTNNPRAGISTFDLILTAKHITGQLPFDSPKKMIAADVNGSQSISTFDIIEMRKFILFINMEFPDVPQWYFLPADFPFTDPNNPWLDDFSTNRVQNLQNDLIYAINPIRTGDINNSSWDNFSEQPAETRSAENLKLKVVDRELIAGQTYNIDITSDEFKDIMGYQFALELDPNRVELLAISPTENSKLASGNFFQQKNVVTFSWYDLNGLSMKKDASIFQLKIKAKQNIALSQVLSLKDQLLKGEAYFNDLGTIHRLELVFGQANQNSKATQLTVFPNPMRDKAQVNYQITHAGEMLIEILSLTGRVVQRVESGYREAGSYTLPITKLDSGMYFIRMVQNGKKVATKRVAVY